MSADKPDELGLLAKLVLVLAVLLIVSGIFWHGVHLEVLQRIWHDLIGRADGPMTFRFILQPVMATIAALHDGVKDARTGRSPYFWTVLHLPEKRSARLREGLNSTARIILLGLGMDAIYQYKVFGTFYPVEALDIAILLAFVPYLLLRGIVERIAARFVKKATKQP